MIKLRLDDLCQWNAATKFFPQNLHETWPSSILNNTENEHFKNKKKL